MVRKRYQFGHLKIEIAMPDDMEIPENFEKFSDSFVSDSFVSETGKADGSSVSEMGKSDGSFVSETEKSDGSSCGAIRYYTIQWVSDFEQVQKLVEGENPVQRVVVRENMRILEQEGRECRILYFPEDSLPYAVYWEIAENQMQVWVLEEIRELLKIDTVFVSLLALERQMIQEGALLLHSAYICRNGKAILFSAPSETGKSTQAALWEKYRKTRTINGDRALLIPDADGWRAYGWPVCGSSEICWNEAYPIEAIVMLRQAKTNEIRLLKGTDLIPKLRPQITINTWNLEFYMKALDFMGQLIQKVPVYELGCDMSEGAVRCLEQVLERSGTD